MRSKCCLEDEYIWTRYEEEEPTAAVENNQIPRLPVLRSGKKLDGGTRKIFLKQNKSCAGLYSLHTDIHSLSFQEGKTSSPFVFFLCASPRPRRPDFAEERKKRKVRMKKGLDWDGGAGVGRVESPCQI